MVKAHKEEPPYETKGKGIPTTGNSPMVIDKLSVKCRNKIEATQ
jgi:hypothetical protein